MAEDKLNHDSEEDNKPSNDLSDDDFGLPDLEFDELQELDLSSDDEEADQPEEEVSDSSISFSGSEDVDMSALNDLDISDDLPATSSDSVLDDGIDEVEDVLDSAQLISDRLGDDEEDSPSTDFGASLNYDDLVGDVEESPSFSEESIFESDEEPESDSPSTSGLELDDTVISSDDLLASIDSPDDLAALGMADEDKDDFSTGTIDSGGSLFSSDEGFETDDSDSLFDSDSLSLGTESSEEPSFISSSESEKKLPENYKSYSYEESSGKFTKVIVIGLVSLAVVATVLLWLSNGGPDDDSKKGKVASKTEKTSKSSPVIKKKKTTAKPTPKKETATKEPAASKSNTAPAKPTTEPAQVTEKSQPVQQASSVPSGEIQSLSEKTGRAYIIIASFIDEDLANDYANELSSVGKGVTIINPYGSSKRYRLAIANYSTYGDAASELNTFKGEYGDGIWALKY